MATLNKLLFKQKGIEILKKCELKKWSSREMKQSAVFWVFCCYVCGMGIGEGI